MNSENLCLRCNYAYATTTDDDLPVCEGCKAKVKEEAIRNCPVDAEPMKKHFIKNVMIDKCPKCKGIWLDGDEVGLLNSYASAPFESSKSKNETDGKKGGPGKFWKGFVLGAILNDD